MPSQSRKNWLPVLGLVLSCAVHGAAHAEGLPDDDDDKPVLSQGLDINAETQRRIGLSTSELQASEYRPEISAYGVVQDLRPLLEIRQRYVAAQAAQGVSSAQAQQAQRSLARADALYREDIVAQSRLQAQQAEAQAGLARSNADRRQLATLRAEAEWQWGKVLADWALGDGAGVRFGDGEQLLLVALPLGQTLPEPPPDVYLARSGGRDQALAARYVSPAPQTGGWPGETHYFACNDPHLRAGMRVSAWLPVAGGALQGVIVPHASVVWHLGQAFVYVQRADERFERLAADVSRAVPGGYFVQTGLQPGLRLVNSGAQMLLSEEFRSQIPDEDD